MIGRPGDDRQRRDASCRSPARSARAAELAAAAAEPARLTRAADVTADASEKPASAPPGAAELRSKFVDLPNGADHESMERRPRRAARSPSRADESPAETGGGEAIDQPGV
jgi:hypothetical protein